MKFLSRRCFLPVLGLLLLGCALNKNEGSAELNVFVAASLADVVTEIAADYENDFGVRVHINLASSGTLARQIQQGAPCDVYLSASKKWMEYASERKLIMAYSTVCLAKNSLVLIVPQTSKTDVLNLSDMPKQLSGRLSIGDPDHVPLGNYAMQVLVNSKLTEALNHRLLPAKDARSALMMVEMGECELGLVYKTDAQKSSKVKVVHEIPSELHAAINYFGALASTGNSDSADRFLIYLRNSKATWEDFGFLIDYNTTSAP